MNYRHIYHAGNFADVFKHGLLCVLLASLTKKDKPLTYLETHAGCGFYDLKTLAANKTREYEKGIVKLLSLSDQPDALKPYLELVKSFNSECGFRFYPGSPLVAAKLLRENDKMILCELHPEDVNYLKLSLKQHTSVKAAVHHCDGYHGLKAFTPPTPRRGLVLIDPPFEKPSEINDLISGLKMGLSRWPNATYVVWYPIKNNGQQDVLLKKIDALKTPYINQRLVVDCDKSSTRLIGSGMVVINPPFGSEETIKIVTQYLSTVFTSHS